MASSIWTHYIKALEFVQSEFLSFELSVTQFFEKEHESGATQNFQEF